MNTPLLKVLLVLPIAIIFPVIVRALDRLLQSPNAPVPIRPTVVGIFMIPNEVQSINAPLLIAAKFPPSATAGIL